MTPASIYVHVPFCARRCSYCDFAVEAVREPPVEQWLEAVAGELSMIVCDQEWTGQPQIATLYVGGGTPSLLGRGAMAALRRRLSVHLSFAEDLEWTCEANPESFTPELARDWRAAGVDRLSLGTQTFDPAALRWMGRLHGPEGPEEAVRAAREAGFENISLDLIFGLPSELGRDWSSDLRRIIDLGPEHVSLYGLTAEPGASLGRWVAEGRTVLADEDRYADEYLLAHEMLTGAGYEHYEVSNFGRPGLHSRHNFAYWTGAAYVALGPGAHAYYPPVRRWNLRSWSAYREALLAGRLPLAGEETPGARERELEQVWLGLRTSRGLSTTDATERQLRLVDRWMESGRARRDGETVRLTPEGWLLLDELAIAYAGDGEGATPGGSAEPTIDARSDLVQIGANSTPIHRWQPNP